VATFARSPLFVVGDFFESSTKTGSGVMSDVKARDVTRSNKPPGFEGTVRDLPRQQSSSVPRRPDDKGEQASALIGRITLASTHEIDRLVDDLKSLRGKLEDEGSRVQRDIADHSSLSQSVIQLTKIVSDSMAHVKEVSDAPSIDTEAFPC
jgi:hypothetical protein